MYRTIIINTMTSKEDNATITAMMGVSSRLVSPESFVISVEVSKAFEVRTTIVALASTGTRSVFKAVTFGTKNVSFGAKEMVRDVSVVAFDAGASVPRDLKVVAGGSLVAAGVVWFCTTVGDIVGKVAFRTDGVVGLP